MTTTAVRHDDAIDLTVKGQEPRVDSRLLAQNMGKRHQDLFELVKTHRTSFERLGVLLFQTGKPSTGRPERFALLTEDQSYFLLTLTRNTSRTVALKVQLVQAFSTARKAAELRRTEYLPGYRDLHNQVAQLAGDSAHTRFVHQNVNKAINRAVGIEAGQRRTLPMPQQSLLVVAQSLAAKAMAGAHDHHDGYRLAKEALQRLAGALEVTS